ncbi:hypothetical protein BOX15_Mlig028584g2 [Macrostomum lignano]|uniref:FMRFamide-activated amiloride-sensitive sodium channel n=1 Tax=Macrostomum lignano TaxID=282301 RepID=A0A267EZS4_9PLAT|nr:hypothetical protein BOX15_Mlig028584g2 [Macrostomum lignano]
MSIRRRQNRLESCPDRRDIQSSAAGVELRREFIRFCQNTTIRGLPRIVKSDSRRIRTLWLVSVLALFVSCLLCLTFLVNQFLEYDVMHPPRVLKDASSPFPSLTICNMRPLSTPGKDLLSQLGWKNPRQFSRSVEGLTRHLYYSNESTKHIYYSFSGSFGLAAFLESLPRNDSLNLGHRLQDFVLDCRAVIRNGSARNQFFCSPDYGPGRADVSAGTFHAFRHASFLNCFTLDIAESLRNDTTLVEMSVYLDNEWGPDNFECVDCYLQDINTQLSGAILTIHDGDTFPDVNHDAVHLKSGSLTEVKIKNVLNVQKRPPYGRCSADTLKSLDLFARRYKYIEGACRQATIQRDIRDTCGCQAAEYPQIGDPDEVRFCTGLPEFLPANACSDGDSDLGVCRAALERAHRFIKCKQAVISKYFKDVVDSCTLPCSFYSYQTERSTSDWPTKSWQLQLLQSSGFGRLRRRKEMAVYDRAIRLAKAGDEMGAYTLLRNVSLLERNLLSIQLIRPNFDLHKVAEKEVLSLTSFLSQVGGLFSIFIGLTMISVVELIDFCIHCYGVCAMRRGRHRDSGNNTAQSEASGTAAGTDLAGTADENLLEELPKPVWEKNDGV